MENRLIYNAVPAWEKAPAAMDILRKNLLVLIGDMQKRKAEECTVILPEAEEEIAEKIETAAREAGIHAVCILAKAKSGLVYQNHSALVQAASGEKALPSGKQALEHVISAAELGEEKRVYIELPGGEVKKETVSVSENAAEIFDRVCAEVEVKAVYAGFPQAGVFKPSELDQLVPVNGAYLKVIGPEQCMLDEINKIAAQYRMETCGKCVFGHEGSAQIQMIFGDMALKKGKASDKELLQELCKLMRTQTVCEIGSSLADIVLDVLEKFGGEILEHITKKSCPAGVCSKFLTYHILPEKCIGCTDCTDSCEEGAILGRRRFIHVIDQDECMQCGACMEACGEGAIVKAGKIKPRCPKKPIPCKASRV